MNLFEYNQRSILKSTRQKNWLSNPSSTKQVTFQFETPNKVRNLSKKRTTIGRAERKEQSFTGNKRSDMTPFIYTPEEFSEDTATQNIETTKNGSKLKSKIHLLNGDKVPKQFIIFYDDDKPGWDSDKSESSEELSIGLQESESFPSDNKGNSEAAPEYLFVIFVIYISYYYL